MLVLFTHGVYDPLAGEFGNNTWGDGWKEPIHAAGCAGTSRNGFFAFRDSTLAYTQWYGSYGNGQNTSNA